MHSLSRTIVRRLILAGLLTPLSVWAQTSVRTVKVLEAKEAVEIEVEATDRIVPQTQVVTGPDRLVIDFPNSVPSPQLRSQSVDRGQVKSLRVGLYQSNPPVTRIVLDLKTAQSYQVFPNGHTVIIKVMGGGQDTASVANNVRVQAAPRPGLLPANFAPKREPIAIDNAAQPLLDITFRNGLLGIRANKVTLAQVLFTVQQRTGAQVSIAAGAEQEIIAVDIAPAAAADVLARLLNGSNFNFLILSAANDPQRLDRVILTPRTEGGLMPMPLAQDQPAVAADDGDGAGDPQPEPPRPIPPPLQSAGPQPPLPADTQRPEIKGPSEGSTPEQ